MIAWLRGQMLEKQPNRVLVDVNGVGYDVAVPLSTFYALGEPPTSIALRVHTHVREDQLALFGFLTVLELSMFERLIAVSGIGPKLALAVLSGMEPRDLVAAIQRGDTVRLTRIPGVGRKTAERIVLDLRDRLPSVVADDADVPAASPRDGVRDDLVSALNNLGYHRQSIDRTLDALLARGGEETFEVLLRAALKDLSRA